MKNCENKKCKKLFSPRNSIQTVCSLPCAIVVSAEKAKLKESKKKELNLKLKESLKTLGDYKKDLQIEVNKIVRLIDQECSCLACGVTNAKFDASHFRGVGAWDNLRYNLHNIYSGCAQCNTHKGGNLIKFREGIVTLFGESQINYMDDLNVIYPSIKLNKNELLECTKTAKKIVKELTQLNKSAKLPRSTTERIYLRTKYNGELNIYS
jgi:hypothetical protein